MASGEKEAVLREPQVSGARCGAVRCGAAAL